jgi:hypothetical protein
MTKHFFHAMLHPDANTNSFDTVKTVFCTIFSSLLPAEGFQPVTFGFQAECTATVLSLLTINTLKTVFFTIYSLPVPATGLKPIIFGL